MAGRAQDCRVRLTLLETRVDVAVSGRGAQHLADLVATAWEWCLADPADLPAARVVQVFLDPDEAAVTLAREQSMLAGSDELQLMHMLSSHLTVTAIEARLGDLWMLHACALADPVTGATVVLVGPSGSGKTTVAATLGRHFGYLTDETAAIRHDGTASALPEAPLGPRRRPRTQAAGVTRRVWAFGPPPPLPGSPRSRCSTAPAPATPSVEAVRTVEALPALAEQTSALQLLERPLHLVAGHLERTGGLRRITYQEAEDLVPVVAGLIEGAT